MDLGLYPFPVQVLNGPFVLVQLWCDLLLHSRDWNSYWSLVTESSTEPVTIEWSQHSDVICRPCAQWSVTFQWPFRY